ncbi:hypothetical protein M8J75_010632 [Diaphorina citri]|nr:hypothetical protein M8J75_010632 [Diaphorina citri]
MCGNLISECARTTSGPHDQSQQEQVTLGPQPTMIPRNTMTSQAECSPSTVRRRYCSSRGMGGIFAWSILLITFVNGVFCQQNLRDLSNGFEQTQMRYENPDRVREYTSLIELLQNAAALQREQQAAQRAHALNMIGTEGSELPSDVPGMDQYESSNMMSLPAMPLGKLIQNRELQNLIQQQEYNELLGRQEKRGSYRGKNMLFQLRID